MTTTLTDIITTNPKAPQYQDRLAALSIFDSRVQHCWQDAESANVYHLDITKPRDKHQFQFVQQSNHIYLIETKPTANLSNFCLFVATGSSFVPKVINPTTMIELGDNILYFYNTSDQYIWAFHSTNQQALLSLYNCCVAVKANLKDANAIASLRNQVLRAPTQDQFPAKKIAKLQKLDKKALKANKDATPQKPKALNDPDAQIPIESLMSGAFDAEQPSAAATSTVPQVHPQGQVTISTFLFSLQSQISYLNSVLFHPQHNQHPLLATLEANQQNANNITLLIQNLSNNANILQTFIQSNPQLAHCFIPAWEHTAPQQPAFAQHFAPAQPQTPQPAFNEIYTPESLSHHVQQPDYSAISTEIAHEYGHALTTLFAPQSIACLQELLEALPSFFTNIMQSLQFTAMQSSKPFVRFLDILTHELNLEHNTAQDGSSEAILVSRVPGKTVEMLTFETIEVIINCIMQLHPSLSSSSQHAELFLQNYNILRGFIIDLAQRAIEAPQQVEHVPAHNDVGTENQPEIVENPQPVGYGLYTQDDSFGNPPITADALDLYDSTGNDAELAALLGIEVPAEVSNHWEDEVEAVGATSTHNVVDASVMTQCGQNSPSDAAPSQIGTIVQVDSLMSPEHSTAVSDMAAVLHQSPSTYSDLQGPFQPQSASLSRTPSMNTPQIHYGYQMYPHVQQHHYSTHFPPQPLGQSNSNSGFNLDALMSEFVEPPSQTVAMAVAPNVSNTGSNSSQYEHIAVEDLFNM